MKTAKNKKTGDAATVVCSACGREIPPNPANGFVTDCVWVNDRYLCWDCHNGNCGSKQQPQPRAERQERTEQVKPAPPPKPATPPPPPPPPKPKKAEGWNW